MNENNWYYDNSEESELNENTETYISKLSQMTIKIDDTESSHPEQINNDMPIKNEDLRKDVQMKSILRRIRRDFRYDFFLMTSFDVKRKTKRVELFLKSLDKFSSFLFGENVSSQQQLVLGSLISTKYMQRVIKDQCLSNEINEKEFDKFTQTSKQIHSTLYNFSYNRLLKISSNNEFRELINKHSEFWGSQDMKESEIPYYHMIVEMFR